MIAKFDSSHKKYMKYEDSIIINRNDKEIQNRKLKKNGIHILSVNAEDALTWNFSNVIKECNNDFLPKFLSKITKKDEQIFSNYKIFLWKSLKVPPERMKFLNEQKKTHNKTLEGNTEADWIIETKEAFIVIEAKFKSDISISTKHDNKRDQIIRNLELARYNRGEKKEFFFFLLTPKIYKIKKNTKMKSIYNKYKNDVNFIEKQLPYLTKNDIKDISDSLFWITWEDLLKELKNCCSKELLQQLKDNYDYRINFKK